MAHRQVNENQNVKEKTFFIDERISTVSSELVNSEYRLKNFKEKNRQILSPSLQLEQDRLAREVEVKKSIYLTLKQQLEFNQCVSLAEAYNRKLYSEIAKK